jgi:hypothetical protein
MILRSLRLVFLPCLAGSLLVLQFHCSPTQHAGNSSQIGNGMVVGMLYEPDGVTPAKSAVVHIRKKNTLADTSRLGLSKRLVDTSTVTTNDSGVFRIDTIDTGTYVIEGTSGNNLALIDSVKVKNPDSTKVVPPDTLKPAGAIKGIINLSEGGDPRQVFVLAFGIDRFARVNADGSFKFSNLARGLYDFRLLSGLPNYGILDTSGVRVIEGDTTNLGTISLPFTGISTPKNLKVSFDTLKQLVILTWDKADTALIDGYNIYRAIKGQNFSLITQTPLSETTTTYYDSGVAVGNTYAYRVVSWRTSGEESPKVDIPGDTVNVVSDSLVKTVFTWKLDNTINDTASINDTVRVCVTYSNPTRRLEKISWYLDSLNSIAVKQKTDSLITGNDTLVYWCKLVENKKIIIRVIDETAKNWTDSALVTVVQDVPVPFAGNDTAVHGNSPFTLTGKATQQFGSIVKWEWNIDGAGFKITSSGDTTITTPDLSVKSFICILRVTDDDGNIGIDTVNLINGTWELVGPAVMSGGNATCQSLAFDNGVPYVAFDDFANGHGTTVMRYNGTAWELVGEKGFSCELVSSRSLAISNGVPYVALVDCENGYKATVMRYNGSSWEPVGAKGFSDSTAGYLSLAIDNGIPYVAFDDPAHGDGTTVMRYNGTVWEPVGEKGFSDSSSRQSFAIDNGTPYVSFIDNLNFGKMTVMRYNGTAWDTVGVGEIGYSDRVTPSQSLAIDHGTPYVAFCDVRNGYGTTVMRYIGSAWEPVGIKGFSNGQAYFQSLAIDNGIPYVAFSDDGRTTVMRYTGTAWEPVGKKEFSNGSSSGQSLAVYNGTPYVAFDDLGNVNQVIVMKFW